MTISLKSTLIFSGTLAALLNVWHFAATYQQREDAFAPGWATASLTSQSPAPQPPGTSHLKQSATLTADTGQPAPLSYTPPASAPPAQTLPAAPVSMDQSLVTASLSQAGLNAQFAQLYLNVSSETGTPWQLLAAVHKAETNQSGNTDRTSDAGATGPMQFLPATFDAYAAPGHGDITSVTDAMLAAGRYLAANGAGSGDDRNAVFHYNHSWDYVDRVMSLSSQLGL